MADLFLHRTALVTGASSGLGRQFARQLAAHGCSLVINARSEPALRELAAQLQEEFDVECQVVAADLGTDAGITTLLRALDDRSVPVDHIVNNAGFGAAGAFADGDAEAEAGMVRLNNEAVVRITHHILPGLITRNFGGVLNVASTVGFMPGPFMATYSATKTFVIAFTRALAEELRSSSLHVMALCPGPVETGFQQRAGTSLGDAERLAALSAEEVVRRALIAYEDGMTVYAPGALNKIIACASAHAPWWLSGKIFGWAMRFLGRTQSQTKKPRTPASAAGRP